MENQILQGDCIEKLKEIPDGIVDCCVTSPPYYGLRNYGVDGQIGLEDTPDKYIQKLVDVFREVRRVLKDDGTLWVNIGDTYNGNKKGNTEYVKNPTLFEKQEEFQKTLWHGAKQKDLIGIPWMLAFALRSDGWYLRQDIIWAKPNPMPEPVRDRCVKSHEYIFLLSKSQRYYFDYEAIQEEANHKIGQNTNIRFGGSKYGDNDDVHYQTKSGNVWSPHYDEDHIVRNKRDVWTVSTQGVQDAHFATYPEKLIEPCILAGSNVGGVVLDPFFGSGTTGRVAARLNRSYIGIELNPEYIGIAKNRTSNLQMTFTGLI